MYNPSCGNYTTRDKVFVNSVIVWRLDQSRLWVDRSFLSAGGVLNKAFEASGQAIAMFTYSELDAIQGMWREDSSRIPSLQFPV